MAEKKETPKKVETVPLNKEDITRYLDRRIEYYRGCRDTAKDTIPRDRFMVTVDTLQDVRAALIGERLEG